MPVLRIKEIRDMSSEDRTGKLDEFRTELLRLKTMIGAGGTVENPARVKALRKTIAKMLTVEHEEKHGIRRAEPKKEPKQKEPKKKAEPKRKKKAETSPKETAPKKTEPRKRKKT